MIELTPLARPYAKALFASALESKNVEEISSELKTIALASTTEELQIKHEQLENMKSRMKMSSD